MDYKNHNGSYVLMEGGVKISFMPQNSKISNLCFNYIYSGGTLIGAKFDISPILEEGLSDSQDLATELDYWR